MNNTTMPEASPSPGLKIITDLDNEEVNKERQCISLFGN
jgi:hypothetical protein